MSREFLKGQVDKLRRARQGRMSSAVLELLRGGAEIQGSQIYLTDAQTTEVEGLEKSIRSGSVPGVRRLIDESDELLEPIRESDVDSQAEGRVVLERAIDNVVVPYLGIFDEKLPAYEQPNSKLQFWRPQPGSTGEVTWQQGIKAGGYSMTRYNSLGYMRDDVGKVNRATGARVDYLYNAPNNNYPARLGLRLGQTGTVDRVEFEFSPLDTRVELTEALLKPGELRSFVGNEQGRTIEDNSNEIIMAFDLGDDPMLEILRDKDCRFLQCRFTYNPADQVFERAWYSNFQPRSNKRRDTNLTIDQYTAMLDQALGLLPTKTD